MSTGKVTPARSRGGTRRTVGTKLDKTTAQKRCLDYIEAGHTVASALEKVGRSMKTWELWRRDEPDFKARADLALATRNVDDGTREGKRAAAKAGGFAAWRLKYLNVPTYPHQQQWVDLIEGREPSDLHEAQTYQPGRRNRLIVNTPPFHGKSITLSVDYSVYRICIDPSVRIRIVSKTITLATDFVGAIKMRLTHPRYAKLIEDFAPEGGFKATAESWTQDTIFLDIADRDGIEKDPTVAAAGLGKQIYGTRADLIILDDVVDLENANQWRKQMGWLSQEVDSRLGPAGKILVVGTRVSPVDLYKELRNGEHFGSGTSPWTYLSQPAILEEAGEVKEWTTLWPKATESWGEECDCGEPECLGGLDPDAERVEYPRWDGTHLSRLRDTWEPRRFALVFQQSEVDEESTFPPFAVNAAINNRRRRGLDGGLDNIPEDCYWIGSMDPATSGNAAAIVYAVDKKSHKRYIVDAENLKAPTPLRLKNLIKTWSHEYPIKEWRVEKTGLLTFFTQDAELRSWLSARGIRFTTHYTGSNKWDPSFGVASMSPLFGAWDKIEDGWKCIHDPIVEIPRADTPALKSLIQQLITWTPELDPKKVPCDLVMALWFAEVGARDVVKAGDRFSNNFGKSKFHSPRQLANRQVINLAEHRHGRIA